MIRLYWLRMYRWWIKYDIAQIEAQRENLEACRVDWSIKLAELNSEITRQENALGRMPTC